jgi:hypothetical protein
MPAIAILLAMYWQKLSRWGLWLALFLQAVVVLVLAWLSWNIDLWSYPLWHFVLLAISVGVIGIGLIRLQATKTAAILGCFLSYLCLTSSIMPLDGPLGRFDAKTIAALQGKTVWFPCDFRAKDEEYRMLIPGANIKGYPVGEAKDLDRLAQRYPLFAVQAPVTAKLIPCPDCEILGKRLEMRARHHAHEIKEMLMGKVSDNLFVNEYIISVARNAAQDINSDKDACR